MILFPKEVQALVPALYATDGVPAEVRKVPVKIFNPSGNGIWYILEANFETGEAFGYVDLLERELGYIDLNELIELEIPVSLTMDGVEVGKLTVKLERDIHWDPNTTLADVVEGRAR